MVYFVSVKYAGAFPDYSQVHGVLQIFGDSVHIFDNAYVLCTVSELDDVSGALAAVLHPKDRFVVCHASGGLEGIRGGFPSESMQLLRKLSWRHNG